VNLKVRLLRRGFEFMVRTSLRGVWVRGDPPVGRAVWAANHHSWWDPFVAQVMLDRAGRGAALVMDDENLSRFSFLRPLGVVGTRELRAAIELVRMGRVLVVFPEAELRAPGPLGPLYPGAAWLARRGEAQLLAVATRVSIRGHEAPEAHVHVQPVVYEGDHVVGTTRLAETMSAALSSIDAALATADPREPLPGFRALVRGRRSWDERLAGLSRGRSG
jgi:1-acyl-sn-glycerol-3-phosphate acyltransferase